MENNERSEAVDEVTTPDTAEAESDTVSADTGEHTTPDEGYAEADSEGSENAAHGEDGDADEPFLVTRYNHQTRNLTREEAVSYAQKGMAYEKTVEKIRLLAAMHGQKAGEYLNAMIESKQQLRREELLEKVGGDEELAKRLYDSEVQGWGAAADAELQAEKAEADEDADNLNRRLAEDFIELHKEFPDIADFASLPKSVKRESAEKNIPLLDAYLRFMHREKVKTDAANSAAAAASAASAGSQLGDTDFGNSPEIEAMRRAVWRN